MPKIKILEPKANKRGDLFGRLVSDLFLALGYEDIKLNIHKAGREIDIVALHRTEPRSVIAECKATDEPTGGGQINKFIGVLDAERRLRRNDDLEVTGYFISLSGFTETAIEQETETGKRIILLDGHKVIKELIDGRIIAPIERVTEQAGRCAAAELANIKLETTYELLAHEMGWVWAVYYSHNKKTTHFALIHADGEALAPKLAEVIIEADTTVNGTLQSLCYLPLPPEPTAIESLIPEAKEKYFQYLLNECGEIQLEGLPADQEVSVRRLNLENIFVPLFLDSMHTRGQDGQGRESVGQVLERHARLSILAPPGGGKSTLLKRLAVAYAFPERHDLADDHLPRRSWFPLFFRCRHLGSLSKATIREILSSIPERAELNEEHSRAFVLLANRALRNGEALLLVDGLDEISDESSRVSFVNQMRTFLATYPTVNIIITSREVGFRLVGGVLSSYCEQYRLADFNEEDIKRLTLAWHKEVAGNKPEIRLEAGRLVEAICKSDRVRQLAKNPLLLTTLLLVKRWVGQLPNRRSVLYGKAIEVLLMTWNVEAHQPIDQDEAIPQLAFVAFTMMHKGIQEISIKKLREILVSARKQMPEVLAYAKTSISEFIDLVEFRSSILVLSGNKVEDGTIYPVYEFRHLTFQEYLAARSIVEGYYPNRKESDTLLSVVSPHLSDARWKEAIPLAAILAGRKVQPLVEHLIGATKTSDKEQFHPEALLAQCIIDEVQISPNLLQEALDCIIKCEAPVGSLTIPILRSKYGSVLSLSVQQQYFECPAVWRSMGNLFALMTLDQCGLAPGKMITEQFAKQVKVLLTQGDDKQKTAGSLAIMQVSKSLKIPGAWPVLKSTPKALFEELTDQLIPCLYSDYPPLYFAVSWALGCLAEIKIWHAFYKPEVLKRLLDIWSQTTFIEAKEMAAWVISKAPVEFRFFSQDDAALINTIKSDYQRKFGAWDS